MRDSKHTRNPSVPLVERPNKSQLKREMNELQALGTQLVEISSGALQKMPIDDELMDAIKLARKIRNTREGYRRQLQLIGKLMRNRDSDAIKQALGGLQRSGEQENARFHALEKWRDRILAEGDDAIQAFILEYPAAERQKMRQLVRQAEKEAAQEKPPAASRQLFKYLRESSES
ncbi:hypothetical protein CWE09_08175 [Aliidiomarina minuta]|uniref:Dual-action ribosomal maturation protein DarP n=1 Tax=Aliidiomarina minuta TaxID=880057 RepID=A0A432W935_9GAMM|nr:ribosome biogenesis factor YjgA [Aliidiomarina minuta]RUO26663.1 hypothetical protein CWE09_08175 [Aliidiomarina minuta]